MADYGSVQQSPRINYRQLITSSIFSSPRLFTGFASKGSNETESTMSSPTSILDNDNKPFSALKNPFWPEPNKTPKPENKTLFDKQLDSRGLVDALILDEESESILSKTNSRLVLFGSDLRIQVPCVVSPNEESPKSPSDFGIKTSRNSHFGPFSPCKSLFSSSSSGILSSLSASEMELSEDYTCVISYGPNPRTTHIFDDCIVDSCGGVVKFSESRKESVFLSNGPMSYPSESFLSGLCYNCKKNLGQGKDMI